jgi:epoxyqueuosine reductase QueG
MKDRPSERWAHTRLFGEQFNRKLQAHLVSVLEEKGHFAVAPEMEESLFRMLLDQKVGLASTWSQRHVAFSAGLGTFGLSDGLITAAGKGHRVGSVVVDRALESPERTEEPYRDCLSHRELGCRTCIKRCPADAISESGHDKARCMEFVMKQIPVVKEEYGIDIYGCGLCQTGVPCAEGVPQADPK